MAMPTVSEMKKIKVSKESVALAAKAQIAAQSNPETPQPAPKPSKAQSASDKAFYKAEWLASRGNSPYMVENIYQADSDGWLEKSMQYQTILALVMWANAALQAMPEYDGNGNLIVDCPSITEDEAAILNKVADGMDMFKQGNTFVVVPTKLKLGKNQKETALKLVQAGYLVDTGKGYAFTTQGLGVYGLTWADVKANYLAALQTL